jgi:pentapeptide MXKDX repeat protein
LDRRGLDVRGQDPYCSYCGRRLGGANACATHDVKEVEMKLQKKLVSLIAAGLLVFGAAACNGDDADNGTMTDDPMTEETMTDDTMDDDTMDDDTMDDETMDTDG